MANADETTIKLRAYSDNAERIVPQNNLTEEQNNALELVKKTAQLEEEKKKSLEQMKTIEHLRECLKQEQARTAEMAEKIAGLEAKVEESVGLGGKAKEFAELEAKVKKFAELEAKVKELTEVLGKISGIAAAGKVG